MAVGAYGPAPNLDLVKRPAPAPAEPSEGLRWVGDVLEAVVGPGRTRV